MIAVNKADGDNVARAKAAAAEYQAALHILTPKSPHWSPPVITYSALTEAGIDRLWNQVTTHHEKSSASGERLRRRRQQQVKWMWTMLEERITSRLRSEPAIRSKLPQIERAVAAGTLSPMLAVEEIAAAAGL
jgi:LAO/AO transport system kinase